MTQGSGQARHQLQGAQAPRVGGSPPLFYYIHLCLYVHVCVCHGLWVEVTGQLAGVLFYHVGCGDHTQATGLGGSYLPVQPPH